MREYLLPTSTVGEMYDIAAVLLFLAESLDEEKRGLACILENISRQVLEKAQRLDNGEQAESNQ